MNRLGKFWILGSLFAQVMEGEPLAIIRDNCISCHSEEKRKGGLLLSTRQGILKGGETGKAINLEKPEESLLIKLLQKDADPHMPPKKQLSKTDISSLSQWIAKGLKWDAAILKAVPDLNPIDWDQPSPFHQPSHALAMAQDGKTFAVSRGRTVDIRRIEEKGITPIHQFITDQGPIHSLAWSPDGKVLAGGSFRKVNIWNIETGQIETTIEDKLTGSITALTFLNEGQRLIIADSLPTQLGQLHIIRPLGWTHVKSIRAHTDSIFALTASADGKLLASSSADKLTRLWNADTLQPVGNLEGHTGYVLAATFSPDSQRIATTSADRSVKIWNPKTLNEDITFSARNAKADATGIVWTLDPNKEKPEQTDDWIVTISDDNTPRLYTSLVNHEGKQTSTGAKERAWSSVGKYGYDAIAWSSKYKRILMTDGDGQLHFLDSSGKNWQPQVPKDNAIKEPIKKANTLSFRNDILPILTRAGCADGSCHAKSGGQNGFQLSIFSYDPKTDHHALAFAGRGRRTMPDAPAQSLLLRKATESISHEGGQRIKPDSEFYQIIHDWIAQGTPYGQKDEPKLERLSVSPKEGTYMKGAKVSLNAKAHYSDGSTRDVTHLAHYQSNDLGIASIDENGHATLGNQSGESALIVRYMDAVEVARVAIPSETNLPPASYENLLISNPIDRHNYDRHKQLGLLISDKCSDSEFLRRATLDTIGRLPHPETARKFLKDTSADKRKHYIEKLLNNPDWADYWATRFNDLLRPNTQRVGVKPVYLLDRWVRRKLRENTPWDTFVSELLTASGSSHKYGPVAFFRDKREPHTAGAFASRIFLGVRLECAQCHHHPSEKWGQDDYYQLAAFFGSMKRKGQGISAPISGEPEYWWFQPGGTVKHPVTDAVMKPTPPGGHTLTIADSKDPRTALVEWMLEKDNPYFAKAIVNRIWAAYFGIGIVDPVDDFRESNPPSNAPLLDWLAKDFVENGYDLKHLMRRILHSRTYQSSSLPNATNSGDHRNFSRSLRRRLRAEVMADAVTSVTDIAADFQGLPARSRAMHVWNTTMPSVFLDTFGRPDSSAECPCERDPAPTITQALHLANSSKLIDRIALGASRATKLAKSDLSTEHIVEEIYLAAFSRLPTEKEQEAAIASFASKDATRQTATEDLIWALLNTAEFMLNH